MTLFFCLFSHPSVKSRLNWVQVCLWVTVILVLWMNATGGWTKTRLFIGCSLIVLFLGFDPSINHSPRITGPGDPWEQFIRNCSGPEETKYRTETDAWTKWTNATLTLIRQNPNWFITVYNLIHRLVSCLVWGSDAWLHLSQVWWTTWIHSLMKT